MSRTEDFAGGAEQSNLSDRDRSLLDFEKQRYTNWGAKEKDIHANFGMSWTRYHQHINRLIDSPAAAEHSPELISGLRAKRDANRERRTKRRTGNQQ